jgi:hypothetical protein
MGTVSARSWQSFMIGDHLLAKVVAAIKQGEDKAKSSGTIQSLQVFYEGLRQHIVIGRVMIVPASVADNLEDFPLALLYGAIVREFGGEEVSDLLEHKIGESEFDEYSKADYQEIKDRLFKNEQSGKYESIVMFLPAWTNPREYVMFKYTKDDQELANLVRHLIFSCYFDPALSSAFETLTTDIDTARVDVCDVTPKMQYPFITENPLKNFPELEKGDEVNKKASARKPYAVLSRKTAAIILAENNGLEPGETQVLAELTKDFTVKGEEIKAPEEVGKTTIKEPEGIRAHPDYGEPGSFTSDMNIENSKGASVKFESKFATIEHKPGHKDSEGKEAPWCNVKDGKILDSHASKEEAEKALRSHEYFKSAGNGGENTSGNAGAGMLRTPGVANDADAISRLHSMEVDRIEAPAPKVSAFTAPYQKPEEDVPDDGYCDACDRPASECICGKTAATHSRGFSTKASKKAADREARLAKLRPAGVVDAKTADVNMDFDSIWNAITEDLGPAPLVELKETKKSEPKAESTEPKAESTAPAAEPKSEEPKSEPKAEPKEDDYWNADYFAEEQEEHKEESHEHEAEEEAHEEGDHEAEVEDHEKEEDDHEAEVEDHEKEKTAGKFSNPFVEKEWQSDNSKPEENKVCGECGGPLCNGCGECTTKCRCHKASKKKTAGEPQVSNQPFSALLAHDKDLGLVIMGAGAPQQAWVNGIAEMLVEEGIAKAPVFSEAFIIDGNVSGKEGRTDLALIFSPESQPNVGTLAMWRISFGNASWVDDFIANYGKDYGEEKIEWPEEQTDESMSGIYEDEDEDEDNDPHNEVTHKGGSVKKALSNPPEDQDTAKRLEGDTSINDASSEEEDHTGIKIPATEKLDKFAGIVKTAMEFTELDSLVEEMKADGFDAETIHLIFQTALGAINGEDEVVGSGWNDFGLDARTGDLMDELIRTLIQEYNSYEILEAVDAAAEDRSEADMWNNEHSQEGRMASSKKAYPDPGSSTLPEGHEWEEDKGAPDGMNVYTCACGAVYGENAGEAPYFSEGYEPHTPEFDERLKSEREEGQRHHAARDEQAPPEKKCPDCNCTSVQGIQQHYDGCPALREEEEHAKAAKSKKAEEAKHPLDSKPYDLQNAIDPKPKQSKPSGASFNIKDFVKTDPSKKASAFVLVAAEKDLPVVVEGAPKGKTENPETVRKDEREDWVTNSERPITAGFSFFYPGQALQEFYPEIQGEIVDSMPNPAPNEANNPMINDFDVSDAGKYVSTAPSAVGVGIQGQPQILNDSLPLRNEQGIRGIDFMDEYHGQLDDGIPSALLASMKMKKTANKTQDKEQFSEFIKLLVGEIAAAFISAFKVTSRPILSKVPGKGSISLEFVESSTSPVSSVGMSAGPGISNGSRIRSLLADLNDTDLQDIINDSWAQAAVWHDDPVNGYVYEVFVRAESIDKDALTFKYSFITGTKEAELVKP